MIRNVDAWSAHSPIRNIPFDAPGFYDHPNFLTQEQKDPRFLELYARYVEARQYGDSYLADAAAKIDIAANALASAVKADGRRWS